VTIISPDYPPGLRGADGDTLFCPYCGTTERNAERHIAPPGALTEYDCRRCGRRYREPSRYDNPRR
jgi:DNA-directed RNA polymerase subunit RPC12/RpoP